MIWVLATCVALGTMQLCLTPIESENRNIPDAFDFKQGCLRWIEKNVDQVNSATFKVGCTQKPKDGVSGG